MSRLSWEYKLTLFCVVCSVILCALLGFEWHYAKQYRSRLLDEILTVKKADFEMQAIPTYPFSQVPVEQYTDFVERPLVFEGRKPIAKMVEPPAPVAVEAPKPPPGEFGLILTGIVKTPKGVRALFQNPQAKVSTEKNIRLAEGEEFNGWKLIAIKADKVSIQAESDIKEITLLKAKPKTAVMGVGGVGINPFAPPPNMNTAPPPNVNPFQLKH